MKEFYYVDDFNVAPTTVRKRAKHLKIEQKTHKVYWSTRPMIYFTPDEYKLISHFDYWSFIKNGGNHEKMELVMKDWSGYKCKCGVHKTKKGLNSKNFTWGTKYKCNGCMKRERIAERVESRKSYTEKIADHFKAHYV